MAPTKQKALDPTKAPAPLPPAPAPVSPPKLATPVPSNAERAAAAHRAEVARSRGVPEPSPLELERRALVVGWDLFLGPYVGVQREVMPVVFELMGHAKLEPSRQIRDAIWPQPMLVRSVPVRFGNIAKGRMSVYKDTRGVLHTVGEELLPFSHEGFPPPAGSDSLALSIRIVAGEVTGELVMTRGQGGSAGFLPPIKRITEENVGQVLGLDDLQDLDSWLPQNSVSFGKFEFTMMPRRFLLDGVFPKSDAKPSFFHVRNGDRPEFRFFADVEARGIKKSPVEIKRDVLDQLSVNAKLAGTLTPKPGHILSGTLDAHFSRGKIDIRGALTYHSPKIRGEVHVQVTDLVTAREAARLRLGDLAPADEPSGETAPNGLALWGWGALDFDFNEWLKGRAEVIVDADGYVTTLGHIAPTKTIPLFDRWEDERTLYEWSDWGVVFVEVIPVPWWAGVTLTAHAYVGPAVLGDIVIEGVYSTHPRVTRQFSIAGTVVIPAEVGANLYMYSKGGIPKLANASVDMKADATIKMQAGARPRIGWDRPGRLSEEDPASGGYFIDGEIFAGADVVLGLEAGVGGQLLGKSASWKPIHASWTLGRLSFHAGGKVYLGKPGKFKTFSFAPGSKHKKAEYDGLLEQARQNKFAAGEEKEDPIEPKWTEGVTRAEEEPPVETPANPTLPEIDTLTPALAGGNLPADEVPALPAPPGSKPGPTTGTTVTPPAPTPAPAAPTPVPPSSTPAPAVPTTPSTPAVAEPSYLVETFEMSGEAHALYLTRGATPQVWMASVPPGRRLSEQLGRAVRGVKFRRDNARGSGTFDDRSMTSLEEEHDRLEEILVDCLQVEHTARELGFDVGRPVPEHVPGFKELASELRGYADQFDRQDLVSFLPPARPNVSPPAAVAPRVWPTSWAVFRSAFNEEFAGHLQRFRGNADLEPTPKLKGGEGWLFLSDRHPQRTFKRWYDSVLDRLFLRSVRWLREASDAIAASPELAAILDVVQIYEVGPDWIERDFDPGSNELRTKMSVAGPSVQKALDVISDMERVSRLSPVLRRVVDRLRSRNVNLHWSSNGKILIIDLQ